MKIRSGENVRERLARLKDTTAGGDVYATTYNCPACAGGKLVKRHGKFGEFWGCSRWPDCTYTQPMEEDYGYGESY